MTTNTETASATGNGKNTAAQPLKIERSLFGAAMAQMEIAERVVNGQLGTQEAREASKALSGMAQMVKTELEALRVFEKGSGIAKEHAMRILDHTNPELARIEAKKS